MLDVHAIDLRSLAEALEDHSDETSWWLDPNTGAVRPHLDPSFEDPPEDHPSERGWIAIEPVHSSEGYRDMEDFIARVGDPRARDLLARAIQGRGAFRRFKDTLLEFPDLRQSWFEFHDVRMQRRSVEWLSAEGLIDQAAALRFAEANPDRDLPAPRRALDPFDVARRVAIDLRALYADRLREVILFGSRAREDAHPESDMDLLVVLDEVASPWEELRRMEPVLWRHSFENDTVVTAVPTAQHAWLSPSSPLLRRAREEGRRVA